jgi:hypothetical protein
LKRRRRRRRRVEIPWRMLPTEGHSSTGAAFVSETF